jgi:hypothetical protein
MRIGSRRSQIGASSNRPQCSMARRTTRSNGLRRGSPDRDELRDFLDRLNAIDSIAIFLARWEMTGLDDQIAH